MNLRKKRNYLPNSNKNINFAHFFRGGNAEYAHNCLINVYFDNST